jgi:transposase
MAHNNGNQQRAIALLQKDVPQYMIAAYLGVSEGTLSVYAHAGREAGALAKRPRFRPDPMRALPPEVHAWLVSQLPDGSSMEELVRAIVTDAYLDAMEGAND